LPVKFVADTPEAERRRNPSAKKTNDASRVAATKMSKMAGYKRPPAVGQKLESTPLLAAPFPD